MNGMDTSLLVISLRSALTAPAGSTSLYLTPFSNFILIEKALFYQKQHVSCLEMNNLPNGTEWRILSTNGDVVKSGVSNDERVTVQIQQKGVYILSINGTSHKFVIR